MVVVMLVIPATIGAMGGGDDDEPVVGLRWW